MNGDQFYRIAAGLFTSKDKKMIISQPLELNLSRFVYILESLPAKIGPETAPNGRKDASMATCVVETVWLKGFSSVLNLGITGDVHAIDKPPAKAVKYAEKTIVVS